MQQQAAHTRRHMRACPRARSAVHPLAAREYPADAALAALLHECTGYPTAHPNWKAATFPLNMAEFIENNVTPVHVHVHVHAQVVTHHLTDRLTLYIVLVRKIPVKNRVWGC